MPHALRHLALLLITALLLKPALAGEPAAFAQPRAGLYTGGQPTAAQLAQLAAAGVRTVIDLRTADEPRGYDEAATAAQLGLRYIALPIAGADAITADHAAALGRALASEDAPVLLHCASGNRVGALLALVAASEDGVPAQAALDMGKRAGLKSLEPVVRERLGLPAAPAVR